MTEYLTPLCELGTRYGTDKAPWCWNYTAAYHQWLNPERIVTVLEIGVLNGASLRMWRDFLPNSQVYGVDNEATCMVTGEDRITTFCINAYESAALMPVLDKIGPIDFCVDDAVHQPDFQLPLLAAIWPRLTSGAVYSIEDILIGPYISKVEAAVDAMPDVEEYKIYVNQGYAMLIMRKK